MSTQWLWVSLLSQTPPQSVSLPVPHCCCSRVVLRVAAPTTTQTQEERHQDKWYKSHPHVQNVHAEIKKKTTTLPHTNLHVYSRNMTLNQIWSGTGSFKSHLTRKVDEEQATWLFLSSSLLHSLVMFCHTGTSLNLTEGQVWWMYKTLTHDAGIQAPPPKHCCKC